MARRSTTAGIPVSSGHQSPAEALMELVARFGYRSHREPRPLTNIVFWAGAGFSKAWEPTAPLGRDLFIVESHDALWPVSTSALFGEGLGKVSYEQFLDLVYRLDMYERYPDLRSRYWDAQNIAMVRNTLRRAAIARFKEQSPRLSCASADSYKFTLPSPTNAQEDILKFFDHLQKRSTGDAGMPEGLRPQFITTNYDYVIETILDNIIPDPEESFLLYTYRGITPTAVVGSPNIEPVHDHWMVNHLLKLNGGFEIFNEGAGYVLDYGRPLSANVATPLPVLMLPSREQQYSDPYFQAIFPKAVRLMRESTVLVIVGYSLPEEDALLRFIIRQFAEEKVDGFGKHIFYIDHFKKHQPEMKTEKLKQVFPWVGEHDFAPVFVYGGGFSAFAKECVDLVG